MKTKLQSLKLLVLLILTTGTINSRAQVTTDPDLACVGTTSDYWADYPAPSPNSTYTWTVDGGEVIETGQGTNHITVLWNTSGSYHITVQERDNATNCPGQLITLNVTVESLPVLTISSNSPVCSGSDLNFTGGPAALTAYAWSGPNGFSSTVQNPGIPAVSSAAAGVYTLLATNANGCTSSATITVEINPFLVPTAASNSPVCAGNNLSLSGMPAGMATYSWSGPNGFTSTIQNPAITGVTSAAAGVYTLGVTNGSGCTGSVTVTILINPLPVAAASSNSPVCSGSDLLLTGGPVGMSSYAWTGPNGFASGVQSPTIAGSTASAAGAYTLVITDGNNCSSSVVSNVVINAVPATLGIFHN
jgi:hypothetical protein